MHVPASVVVFCSSRREDAPAVEPPLAVPSAAGEVEGDGEGDGEAGTEAGVASAHVQFETGSVQDVPLMQRLLFQPPQSLHVRL